MNHRMINRLKYNEFVPHAPDAPGTTARINHSTSSCKGNSRSLAVWMNNDGTLGGRGRGCGAPGSSQGHKDRRCRTKSKKVDYEMP